MKGNNTFCLKHLGPEQTYILREKNYSLVLIKLTD